MIELLSSGVLGTLVGGLFRLAPEALKWLDRKGERAHELAMFTAQVDLEKTRGQQKLQELGAQRDQAVDSGVLEAFKSAIQQQTEFVRAAPGKAAKLSATVRPVVTYWLFALWSAIHLFLSVMAYRQGMPAVDAAKMLLTNDFVALVSGTINYWFLDRTLTKRGM